MTLKEIQSLSVETIREEFSNTGIGIQQIFLFGSRARGESGLHSDWDYLVCVKEELSFTIKHALITRIQTRLAEMYVSVDIIIKSEAALQRERTNVGVITHYALKDGVQV